MIPVAITAADAPHLRDAYEVVFAKNQPPYLPLQTLVDGDRVISRWKVEPNDLLLIQNGVDVYLTLYTFGTPLQPIRMTVGPPAAEPETPRRAGRVLTP